MGQQPLVGQGLLIIEVSRSHSRRTTVSKTSLDTWSARRKNYLTTHNTQKRQISMLSAGFEPAIPASERLQTHAFDRAATGIGKNTLYTHGIEKISKFKILYSPFSQYVASMAGW